MAIHIRLVRTHRLPDWPWWAVLIVCIWAATGWSAVLLAEHLDRPVELCLFKHITGVPCPTCGFTRGCVQMMHGGIIRGWLYNPLLFIALGVFMFAVGARVLFGRTICVQLSARSRMIAWILIATVFAANWVYVILYVG